MRPPRARRAPRTRSARPRGHAAVRRLPRGNRWPPRPAAARRRTPLRLPGRLRRRARPPASGTHTIVSTPGRERPGPARYAAPKDAAATNRPDAVMARPGAARPGAVRLARASAAPHSAAASAANPGCAAGWLSAVTAPAAGARVNPVTAHTTAKRAAVLTLAVTTVRP